MKVTKADKFIAWLTLLSGLSISAVGMYYSVAGLISIFAAAAVPIAIMGSVLEFSKISATLWLKYNWHVAPRAIKIYLTSAVAVLMLITSMGIFGYLSRAHLDQGIPTGDVQAKIAVMDEKIKTERENVESNKKALTQLDEAVNQLMARTDDARGAQRAVQLRRQQAKERSALLAEIDAAQKRIAALNEERAPIAAELRKVEAEVGPIKYIAALIYGDNPDANLLERAVRWVITVIVAVFDPLAMSLLLASQYSFQWFRKTGEEEQVPPSHLDHTTSLLPPATWEPPEWTPERQALAEKGVYGFANGQDDDTPVAITPDPAPEPTPEPTLLEQHPYLQKEFKHFEHLKPMVATPEPTPAPETVEELVEKITPENVHTDAWAEETPLEAAKRKWKEEHPNDSLERYESLMNLGLINKWPWEQNDN